MKFYLALLFICAAQFLAAQDHLVWIEAEPDTIFFDNNLTYSIVTALVEDDDNNPVAGVWVYFDSNIGNLLHNIQTDENGIAETTFWESGDLGVATITVERNGQILQTQVTIIMPISADENEIPLITSLRNYPNPFNPSTTISFNLTAADAEDAKINIYNLEGQRVKTLDCCNSFAASARDSRSTYSVIWNGDDENNKPVSSGIYFARIKAGNIVVSRKMTLAK